MDIPTSFAGIDFTLGIFFGGLGCVGWSLISGFAILMETIQNGARKEQIWKRFFLSLTYFFPLIMVTTLVAACWFEFAVNVFKNMLVDPKEIGKIIILVPLSVLIYEATRYANRGEQIDARISEGKIKDANKKIWKFCSNCPIPFGALWVDR